MKSWSRSGIARPVGYPHRLRADGAFSNIFFRKSESCATILLAIANLIHSPLHLPHNEGVGNRRPRGQKRKYGLGGRRNPLKRLVSDKRIQGNPSLFPLIFLARAWPDFARFG